jgi:uncharacterized protein YbjQ (UPF0145 family)
MGTAMDTAAVQGIILATTIEIEGHPVREYYGIVTGEATILVTHPAAPAGATDRPDHARQAAFEQQVREARSAAITAMAERAKELGATAVIAIDIDYTNISTAADGDLLVVAASGTAVLL